jgi:hypothetical protein
MSAKLTFLAIQELLQLHLRLGLLQEALGLCDVACIERRVRTIR